MAIPAPIRQAMQRAQRRRLTTPAQAVGAVLAEMIPVPQDTPAHMQALLERLEDKESGKAVPK